MWVNNCEDDDRVSAEYPKSGQNTSLKSYPITVFNARLRYLLVN